MKVTVVGKEFVSGTSRKTGRPFALNLIHLTHKKNGVDGLVVESIWLDPDSFPLGSIAVGGVYDLDRDNRGQILDFAPVK